MKCLFIALLAVTFAGQEAIALECYNCGYVDGGPTEEFEKFQGFDKSCKTGKQPNSKYNAACIEKSVCGKIVIESESENGKDVKTTIRGCFLEENLVNNKLKTGNCFEKTGKELNAYNFYPGYLVPGSAKSTICTCEENQCNSSSPLIITQTSLMIIILGFLTFKFICLLH